MKGLGSRIGQLPGVVTVGVAGMFCGTIVYPEKPKINVSFISDGSIEVLST